MRGATFETLLRLDDLISRDGTIPPLSTWWREQLGRWYAHGTATRFVGQVGRGGAKSHALAKVALNETLFGDWTVPAGERHFAAIISENVTEAAGRLRFLEAALAKIGVKFTRAGDVIDLEIAPRGFRVLASRIGAVSGFRCFFLGLDEVAKWNNDGTNPATEIAASARAMMVTHAREGGREMIVSSPVGVTGFFHCLVTLGTTDRQVFATAPSWVANPDLISEADTHVLEPDPRIHAREYGAVPQDGALAALDGEVFASRIGVWTDYEPLGPSIIALDSTGGRGTFAWCRLEWARARLDDLDLYEWDRIESGDHLRNAQPLWSETHNAWTRMRLDDAGRPVVSREAMRRLRPRLIVRGLRALIGGRDQSSDEVIAEIARDYHAYGARVVVGDQYSAWGWQAAFARNRAPFRSIAWTAANKSEAVTTLRRMLAEGTLLIEANDETDALRAEASNLTERVTASGISFTARAVGANHADRLSAVLTGLMADREGWIHGSPTRTPNFRTEIGPEPATTEEAY